VLENRDFTPVITWCGSEQLGIEGFHPGNEMTIVVKAADGTTIPAEIADSTPKFAEGAYTSVTLEKKGLPTEFTVEAGYPNPFNPSITVPFAVPLPGEVTFAIFNILGQEIYQTSSLYQPGYHRFIFTTNEVGGELVSGVYFLKVKYDYQVKIQKMMLLK